MRNNLPFMAMRSQLPVKAMRNQLPATCTTMRNSTIDCNEKQVISYFYHWRAGCGNYKPVTKLSMVIRNQLLGTAMRNQLSVPVAAMRNQL
jgi:hypothetical protein